MPDLSNPQSIHRATLPERRRILPTSTGLDDVIGWLDLAKRELDKHPQQSRDFVIIALDLLGKEVGLYGLMDRLDAESGRKP